MSWARIDDGFDDHPKILALLEEDQGAAAVGLWTLCLTWAHRNTRRKGKTPGLIPPGLPRRYLGQQGRDLAKLLVVHHLWEESELGWAIHDFADYLPTEETRAARSEAGKRGAEKRWEAKRKAEAEQAEAEAKQDDGKLSSSCQDDASNSLANDGSRAPAHRVPIPVPEPVVASNEATTQRPSDAVADKPRSTQTSIAGGPPDPPLRVTQRSKLITDAYSVAEPMCKWPAVNNIVIKAIKAEKWTDAEIQDAVLRLAADKRGVTVDTLRVELDGPPAAKNDHKTYQNPADQSVYDEELKA